MIKPIRATLAVAFTAAIAGLPGIAMAHHPNAAAIDTRPVLVADEPPPTTRGCIPGPHQPGRIQRLPGTAMMSARPWAYARNVEAYPHCRYASQAEADRAARRGE